MICKPHKLPYCPKCRKAFVKKMLNKMGDPEKARRELMKPRLPFAIVPDEEADRKKIPLWRGVRDRLWEKDSYIPPILDATKISLMENEDHDCKLSPDSGCPHSSHPQI